MDCLVISVLVSNKTWDETETLCMTFWVLEHTFLFRVYETQLY